MDQLIAFIANATTVIVNGGWIIIGLATVFGFGAFILRKSWRMSRNLSRPLAIVGSSEDKMAYEKQLLEDTKFFKPISLLDGDHRAADLIDGNYRLVVLRYEANSDHFWSVYDKLQSDKIPVIVYAKPGEIKGEDIQRVQKYLHHTLCNTPVRLLSDVWTIMSTYPEGGAR